MAGSREGRHHRHGDHDALNVLGELSVEEAQKLVALVTEGGEGPIPMSDFYSSRVAGEEQGRAGQQAISPVQTDQTGRAQPRTRDVTPSELARQRRATGAIGLSELATVGLLGSRREGGGIGTLGRLATMVGTVDYLRRFGEHRITEFQRVQRANRIATTARARASVAARQAAGAGLTPAQEALALSAYSARFSASNRSILMESLKSIPKSFWGALFVGTAVFATPPQGSGGQFRARQQALVSDIVVGLLDFGGNRRLDEGLAKWWDRITNARGGLIGGAFGTFNLRQGGLPALSNRFDPGRDPFGLNPIEDYVPIGPREPSTPPVQRLPDQGATPVPTPRPVRPPSPFERDDVPLEFYRGMVSHQEDEDGSTLVMFRMNPRGQRTVDAMQAELNSRQGRREAIRIV